MYAGIISCNGENMVPQKGLNDDDVVISFILPSGVSKLTRVFPDTDGMSQPDKLAIQGIFGISGTLVASDYAYTTVATLKAAVAELYREGNGHALSSIFIDAQRGDGVSVGIVMGKGTV
jgi:hypothetical protein